MSAYEQKVIVRIEPDDDPTSRATLIRYGLRDDRAVRYAVRVETDTTEDGGKPDTLVAFFVLNRPELVGLLTTLATELDYENSSLAARGGQHLPDCAVHNEPTYPAGPCDCYDREGEK